jgi:Cd2+/Zn2+-exporting ATPase
VTEKHVLDPPLLLLGIPDERDACVGWLTELLQAEGLEKAHLVREDGAARLCLCLCLHSRPAALQRKSDARAGALMRHAMFALMKYPEKIE